MERLPTPKKPFEASSFVRWIFFAAKVLRWGGGGGTDHPDGVLYPLNFAQPTVCPSGNGTGGRQDIHRYSRFFLLQTFIFSYSFF